MLNSGDRSRLVHRRTSFRFGGRESARSLSEKNVSLGQRRPTIDPPPMAESYADGSSLSIHEAKLRRMRESDRTAADDQEGVRFILASAEMRVSSARSRKERLGISAADQSPVVAPCATRTSDSVPVSRAVSLGQSRARFWSAGQTIPGVSSARSPCRRGRQGGGRDGSSRARSKPRPWPRPPRTVPGKATAGPAIWRTAAFQARHRSARSQRQWAKARSRRR